MKVGEVRRISTGNISLDATVKSVRVYRNGSTSSLMVVYDIPGYGETQPFEYFSGNAESESARRIGLSMMPNEYRYKTAKDFDWGLYDEDVETQKQTANAFITRYSSFEKSGRGLYIFSKTKGTGKTYLACILANEVLKYKAFSVKFVNCADLIELIKNKDDAAKEALSGIYHCRLLILDDVGAQDGTQPWINEAMFRLIDYRYREKRPVIFTSNTDTTHLTCDERIKDRIDAMSVPLKMPEKPVRKQIARRETGEFLKSIIGNGEEE